MSRRTQAIILGVITGAWVLALPLIGLVSVTSVMLSDAGSNDAIMAMIYISLAWPVVSIAGMVLSWVSFGFRWPVPMWIGAAIPLIWLLVMVAAYMALSPSFPSGHG